MFIHFERRALLSLSPITLIFDSVPDFRTSILPLRLINFDANFIEFLISGLLIISLSFLAPDYVLGKFYPKFNEQKLSANSIQNMYFDPSKEVHIKVTRITEYGERYKLFVIDKQKFENKYNLEEYGVTLIDQNDQLTVDKLNWKGEAKKSGIQMGDIISNFKIENPERPNKAIVYPFALIFLFIVGYLNYRRKT